MYSHKKDLNKLNTEHNNQQINNNIKSSNPIRSNIIAKINTLNYSTCTNRVFNSYQTNTNKSLIQKMDVKEFISNFNNIINNKKDITELFYGIHNLCSNSLNCNYTAIGLINSQSNCINLKLIDKLDSIYSHRVLLNNTDSPIVKVFNSKTPLVEKHSDFLFIPHIKTDLAFIYPLIAMDEMIGIIIFGASETIEFASEQLKLISNYLGLFASINNLEQKVQQNFSYDTLTNLYNHRKIQEILKKELDTAQENKTKLSIAMIDINNISNINKEFGLSKGDEIINLVASKIKANLRENDSAGRFGGDEFCIILPNTDDDKAKYLSEYFTYTLSCCSIDDIGTIKVSVGISTYPDTTKDLDKLLILAEQAMYISKSKSYENGNSLIVSSSDYNFWDDTALKSFASVLTKRHSQIGINFEEELVNKFHNEELSTQNHLMEVVTSLASAIDAKDEYTKGHSTSVSRYSEALARAINLPEKEVQRIKLGALLHDIGKIGIPESILKKTSKLSDEEWQIMKQHPVIGEEKVLLPNTSLHDLIPMVKYHHEHWDGTGYPERLKGEEIPLQARIVSVADAYHALISDRPYRKGLSVEKACEILRMGAGIQWDKNLVRKFIEIAPALATKI